jgi:acetone carboxylase gamma subunit
MLRHLLKSFLAVKVLAAGDEPNFGSLKIFHWGLHAKIRIRNLTRRYQKIYPKAQRFRKKY